MNGAAPRPDDGVVVYRARHPASLQQAVGALTRAGIPSAWDWRESHAYRSSGGHEHPGEGEVVVPARDVDRAREVLRAWEAAAEARVREHLKALPAQLRRVALFVGLAMLGLMTLAGHAWRSHPTAMLAFAGAAGLLLVVEVRAVLRRRAERAERAQFSVEPPPRWFER